VNFVDCQQARRSSSEMLLRRRRIDGIMLTVYPMQANAGATQIGRMIAQERPSQDSEDTQYKITESETQMTTITISLRRGAFIQGISILCIEQIETPILRVFDHVSGR
jgi:hypothetical protein